MTGYRHDKIMATIKGFARNYELSSTDREREQHKECVESYLEGLHSDEGVYYRREYERLIDNGEEVES